MQSGGDLLKAWRVKRKLTQRALAEKLDVEQGRISKLEAGRKVPDLALAVRIQVLTGIQPAVWPKASATAASG